MAKLRPLGDKILHLGPKHTGRIANEAINAGMVAGFKARQQQRTVSAVSDITTFISYSFLRAMVLAMSGVSCSDS